MPTNNGINTGKNTPIGLSSLVSSNDDKVDVTKIGSRKRGETTSQTKTTTPKANVNEMTARAKTTPLKRTKSNFKVGETNYNIVDDNEDVRKLIKWDDKNNVSPDSPVIVVGKNANNGFILAANENIKGVTPSSFEYSEKSGIHFPSLDSDIPGETPSMQKVHRASYANINDISNPSAASKLRGIYKRTETPKL